MTNRTALELKAQDVRHNDPGEIGRVTDGTLLATTLPVAAR